MDDDFTLILVPMPTWVEWIAFLLGASIAFLVLGVIFFHFADYMRARRPPAPNTFRESDEADQSDDVDERAT